MMPGSTQGTGGPNDDVPWWMRYGAKMLGCVGGGGNHILRLRYCLILQRYLYLFLNW